MTRKKADRSPKPEKIHHLMRGEFYRAVAEILQKARSNACRAVNFAMVEAYWQVGRMIIKEEQEGKKRAGYGEALIRSLSERLTLDFGKGFNVSNLWAFKQFYAAFPILRTVRGESSGVHPTESMDNIDPTPAMPQTLRRELTWSHYRLLVRVDKPEARAWHMKEAAEQDWSVRALERQIHSLCYERLRASRDKKPILKEMKKKITPLADRPRDFIKNSLDIECGDMSPLFQRATRRANQSTVALAYFSGGHQ